MSNLIRAQKLCKSFSEGGKEIRVLQDLELELEEGCSLSIVGESGVGKSTLLHILGTLDRPSGGEVIYRGKDLSQLDDRAVAEFRNREIGFVFQFHYLLPDFTALENVMLPALVQGWGRERAREAALELLDVVGLAERVSHRPGKLSGGEQQRVAVARAAILAPRLILADEPTGDLDVKTGEGIQELLFRLNQESGIALVVATHNRRFSEKFGVRMELREGRLFGL
ncbi:MAG: ABC transporter ATP-binding protein [Deltaproteobacteria bacterium RIFCSPLOWO2_12_FULL_60_19]|nr:MAG: ABC transporter ATP-binding protein [Deltaproteobacteria bacterium RIFCSPLOWO2_12_FULL_60_19]